MKNCGFYILSNLSFLTPLSRNGAQEGHSASSTRKHYIQKLNLPGIVLMMILLYNSNSFAQTDVALPFVNMPASVSSYSLGLQSVALMNGDDALTYNPANLVYTNGTSFSFFRSPTYTSLFEYPVSQTEIHINNPSIGALAFQYRKDTWGKYFVGPPSPPSRKANDYYDASYALGFARRLNESVSAGVEIKYVQREMPEAKSNNFTFSAGINYEPVVFGRQIKLSLSLMNLSSRFETEVHNFDEQGNILPGKRSQYDNPPTVINLGIYGTPIDNSFMQLAAQLALSKSISEVRITWYNYEAQPSYKTIFTDWQDFPGDATLHTGLIFKLKPVNMGGDLQLFQNFYLGNYSKGSKAGTFGLFTHGAEIGIDYKYLTLSVGYAGLWHRVQGDVLNVFPPSLPNESFQVSFGLNRSTFGTPDENNSGSDLTAVYLSTGAAIPLFQDDLTIWRGKDVDNKNNNNPGYSFSAAFYFSRKSAIVTELSYRRITEDIKVRYTLLQFTNEFHIKLRNETISVLSAYRYHPIESLQPLFVEGGIGILCVNPLENTAPKYYYRPIFKIAAGYIQSVTKNLYISPELSYQLVPTYTYDQLLRMGGFNQINAGLQAGYRL